MELQVVKQIGLIFFFSVIIVQFTFCVSVDENKVVLTQILFRHGDRTPLKSYSSDPHLEYWRARGLRQITDIGKQQLYELGTYFRKRYGGLLNATYDFREILVNSTDTDRTLTSAYVMLAGLYPLFGEHLWKRELPWEPIAVHTRPVKEDHIVSDASSCPSYDEEKSAIMASPMMEAIRKENANVFSVLSSKTGIHVSTIHGAKNIHDAIYIEKLYNMTLPSWVDEIYEQMEKMYNLRFFWNYYTTKSQRLRGGPLLSHMIGNMKARINGSNVIRKAYMFSSHDEKVSSFLMALNVFNKITPPYACAVILDLVETEPGKFGVQVYYRNDSSVEPYLLTIPYCSSPCPIDEFVMLNGAVLPNNIEAECGISPTLVGHLSFTVAIVFVCQTVLMLICMAACIICWNKKRNIQYTYAKLIND